MCRGLNAKRSGHSRRDPYAIFVFHDESGDIDLNISGTRLLEGVGASGGPNRDDDPDFAKAPVGPGYVRLHYYE